MKNKKDQADNIETLIEDILELLAYNEEYKGWSRTLSANGLLQSKLDQLKALLTEEAEQK